MRPIDKTSFDLFQKLRSRYSPVTLGNESAESTSDPNEARFFNFTFKEEDNPLGSITISLIDGRGMKVFYSEDMIHKIVDKANWYSFLRELREFAKRNLLTFDARDVAKDQLDARDFNWLSDIHGKVDQKDVSVTESTMYGSKRRSYQTLESVKLIVKHSKTVDESVPGSRSRSIEGIYLERADGERYKFPYNYLTGARAMARHVSEGGTPYDPLGQHVLTMIKEMRDLSKFARMTKTHALEDAQAGSIRDRVVERYQNIKGVLSSLGNADAYRGYAESFVPANVAESGDNIEQLRERFTRRVWDNTMEELLPSVQRALESTEDKNTMNEVEGNKEASEFEGWASNVVEGLSDSNEVAQAIIQANSGAVPVSMEEIYQAVSDYMSQSGDQTINKDEVSQILMDKFGLSEAVPTGTTGTSGTVGTSGAPGAADLTKPDPAAIAQSSKNVARMVQGAGIKASGGEVGKMIQAMVTGKQLPRGGAQTMVGLGNELIQNAMKDPQKANQLTAMLKRMKVGEDVTEEFGQWYEGNMVTEKELRVGEGDEELVDPEEISNNVLQPKAGVRVPGSDIRVAESNDLSVEWLRKLSGL